jgi:flagellar motor switch protein FliM
LSRILSQDEVDALLSGISKGDVPTGTDEPEDSGEISPYDLTSEDRIIRGRMPTLEIINQRFIRSFRTTLSTMLRKVVDLSDASTNVVKFGEFMKTLFVPTSLHVFHMDPIRGQALLVIESNLVFSIIDVFLGGKGMKAIKIEGRDFTNIESHMIRKVVDAALADYERAWNPVFPISTRFARSEVNPQFVSIVPNIDLVVTISFELEIEASTGKLIICIPYGCLEPIRNILQAGFQNVQPEVDRAWVERFRDRILATPVNVTAELGRTQIRGRDLLDLQVGDTLLLDRCATDEMDIRVERILKFKEKETVASQDTEQAAPEEAEGPSQEMEGPTTGTEGPPREAVEGQAEGKFEERVEERPATKKKVRPSAFDFILDIPLEVTVEVGRTRMIIHDLLQLGQGSVIELNKLAGEPLEILVNQKLIARGEIVVMNEKFGVRLTDIISPMERVKQLQ